MSKGAGWRGMCKSQKGPARATTWILFLPRRTLRRSRVAQFFFLHAVSSLDMPSPQGGGEVCSSHTVGGSGIRRLQEKLRRSEVRADQRDSGVLPESESLQGRSPRWSRAAHPPDDARPSWIWCFLHENLRRGGLLFPAWPAGVQENMADRVPSSESRSPSTALLPFFGGGFPY